MTLASLLTDMTSIFAAMMGWVATVMSTIAGNPILLVFVVGSFSLIAVGIVRRLLAL